MMEELTTQQYATRTKQSLFAIIKQIQNGTLKTIKKMQDDKEVELIVCELLTTQQTPKVETSKESVPTQEAIDYEKEFHKLLAKYIALQEKYEKLLLQNQ